MPLTRPRFSDPRTATPYHTPFGLSFGAPGGLQGYTVQRGFNPAVPHDTGLGIRHGGRNEPSSLFHLFGS